MSSRKPLSRDAIKLFAMAAMFCNHYAQALMVPSLGYTVLVDVGYFTAVTMCYFLVEGFGYTRSRPRYALRLLGFALLSQPVYMAALHAPQLNMLFTLFFCFLILWALDALAGRWYRVPAVAALVLVTAWCDWPILAAGYTLLFALCAGRGRAWQGLCFCMAAAMFFLFNFNNYYAAGFSPADSALYAAPACLGILVAGAVVLFLYNGRRSAFALRHPALSKYFFYLFYPGHLALLALARILVR